IARGHQFRTSSDTETIVHLYEDEGAACVERLRGMFAFAIWDQRQQSLLLARDRAGKKPLHYALAGGALAFGSEIKSLFPDEAVGREVNLEAISDFLSYGYVPDPATAFRGIYKLPPGHTLTFRYDQIGLRRYWDFNYSNQNAPKVEVSESEYVERLREMIAE